MGFSKDNFEQYRREIRIMWRVLAVGAVVASGAHLFSLPWLSRLVSGPAGDGSPEIEAIPIEILVEEEVVQQTPEPEPEPPEENPEPVASAEKPSAAPLATNNAEPVPTREVASADTAAVSSSIATENGAVDGQGAVGESPVVGLVTGSGQPTESGDRINLPSIDPPVQVPRTPVQETSLAARPSSAASYVSCNPCSLPEYATSARRTGREGKTSLRVIYGADGQVTEVRVESPSGNTVLDEAAAAEALDNWNLDDSRGTGGEVVVDVVYVLTDSDQYGEAQQAGEILSVPTGSQARGTPAASPTITTSPSTDAIGANEPNRPVSPVSSSTSSSENSSPVRATQSEIRSDSEDFVSPAPANPESFVPDIAPEPVNPPPVATPPALLPSEESIQST